MFHSHNANGVEKNGKRPMVATGFVSQTKLEFEDADATPLRVRRHSG